MSQIVKTINEAFDIVDAVINAQKDDSPGGKKIVFSEKVKIAIEGIGLAKALFAFQQIKEEWLNRTEETKSAMVDTFAARFDLTNDEAEQSIESLVYAIVSFESSIIDLFK